MKCEEVMPDAERCIECPVYKACGWFGDILVKPRCLVDDRCDPDLTIPDLSALCAVVENPDLVLVAVRPSGFNCFHNRITPSGWHCPTPENWPDCTEMGACKEWKWKWEV